MHDFPDAIGFECLIQSEQAADVAITASDDEFVVKTAIMAWLPLDMRISHSNRATAPTIRSDDRIIGIYFIV